MGSSGPQQLSVDDISRRLGTGPEALSGADVAGAMAPVRWWVDDAADARSAEALGLVRTRALHEMRRPLPLERDLVDASPEITVRPFDPATDEEQWLAVNNAAFAWHPDQGGWTVDRLRLRLAEPWVEAAGFLVHAGDDGRLDGFCWTRVHDGDPPVGEIFVIAADPSRHGTGLGRALVVAGLEHLWHHDGTPVASLFVEADNTPAIRLYRRLGFTVARTRTAFERP